MKIAEIISENLGRQGDRHFTMNDPHIEEARNPKSRSALVYMSPAEYLSLIKPEMSQEKLENARRLLAQGVPFKSVPYLSFTHDGKGNAYVHGQEGRHRSMALHELGIKEMPVILHSTSGGNGPEIRWGSQQEGSFDKVPVMPKMLYGQNKRNAIPFPNNVFYPITEARKLPGPQLVGSGKDFRQNAGINRAVKQPGKLMGSGKALKVKPGFVG